MNMTGMPTTLKEALFRFTRSDLRELRTWASEHGHQWLIDAIDDENDDRDDPR